jgi:hypothetical protein
MHAPEQGAGYFRPEGLLSIACVAPHKDHEKYDKTFASILDGVRFAK